MGRDDDDVVLLEAREEKANSGNSGYEGIQPTTPPLCGGWT